MKRATTTKRPRQHPKAYYVKRCSQLTRRANRLAWEVAELEADNVRLWDKCEALEDRCSALESECDHLDEIRKLQIEEHSELYQRYQALKREER